MEAEQEQELRRYVSLVVSGYICPVGVSCRTQEIYLLVFVARYLDLFWLYVSFYNTGMSEKLLSCLIV